MQAMALTFDTLINEIDLSKKRGAEAMEYLDNAGRQRLGDALRGAIGDNAKLSFIASCFTVFAFGELKEEMRKFILIQISEPYPDKSVAKTKGYAAICEIGKERIRRAGAKIVTEIEEANRQLRLGKEPKPIPDIDFRVLMLDRILDDASKHNAVQAFGHVEEKTGREVELRTV